MDTYYVRTNNVEILKDALGRLIEYSKFLEMETGRSNDSYVDYIIRGDNIELEVVTND